MFDLSEKLLSVFGSIFEWMFNSFIEPFFDIPTLKNLVFGRYKDGELIWNTFQEKDIVNALAPLLQASYMLAGFFIIASIIFAGMRTSGMALNYSKRNEAIEFAKDMFIVIILLFNLSLFYDLLFMINGGIVKLFSSAFDANIPHLKMETKDLSVLAADKNLIGSIFINLILLGLMIWANFYYMMRKLTLILLMGFGPLFLAFSLHPRFKGITGAWVKELSGSIFVQSIHAAVYWLITVISVTSTGLIESVILYLIFIPISEALRKLLGMGGDMQGGFAKAGAMMGLSGLAGMYGAAKGALGDKSVSAALKGAYEGYKSQREERGSDPTGEMKNTVGANPGADNGTTTWADKMLKAGQIGSKGGKAILGMAGAVAGSPMGQVGAMAGATIGSEIGGVIGGIAGRSSAASSQLLGRQMQKGIEAAKDGRSGEFLDNFAKNIADDETTKWANVDKESTMKDLANRFPDATPEELEKRFADIQAQKHAGFYKDAKDNLKAVANASGSHTGDPNQLVESSAEGMAQQWADSNQQAFFEDYDKNSPQQPGESNEDFSTRRMNAFNDKVGAMKNLFQQQGTEAVDILQNGNSTAPVGKQAFMVQLKDKLNGLGNLTNVEALVDSADQASQHVQGVDLTSSNGKPNIPYLANQMAQMKTGGMKKDFIAAQMGQGVSESAAGDMWAAQENDVHKQNVQSFAEAGATASQASVIKAETFTGASIQGLKTALNFTKGASGIPELVQGTKNIGGMVSAGISGANVSSVLGELNGPQNILQLAKNTAVGAYQGAVDYNIEQAGGAVNAQQNFQNKAGYAAGLVFGAKAYQGVKNLTSRQSPYANSTQQAISSPAEAIQMAETFIDSQGHKQIAPGAIRQVTTPNESYIEVRGKTGESQIVSRKASGHSGLRENDVVYQDLDVQGDALVVSQPKGVGSSTYRIDSGGARVPSQVEITQNPNTLLGSPVLSSQHRSQQKANAPSYNQAVDSGQFYVEDLQDLNMENVQVVVEKDRSYVQASKNGMVYRVSPNYSGDTQLGSSDSKVINVDIKQNSLTRTDTRSEDDKYITSLNINTLVPSKEFSRIQGRLNKRELLEQARRKQGLLG